jgi:hypothetical protein
LGAVKAALGLANASYQDFRHRKSGKTSMLELIKIWYNRVVVKKGHRRRTDSQNWRTSIPGFGGGDGGEKVVC